MYTLVCTKHTYALKIKLFWWFLCFWEGIHIELNCLFPWLCLSHNTCTLTSFLFTHDLFSWDYMCFIDLWVLMIMWLTCFHGIYSYFIPYLKDFVLVFKIIIKLVTYFFVLEVIFQLCLNYFHILFWKSLPSKGGWLGDRALYAHIENLFKHVHEMSGREYELYTWFSLYFHLVSLYHFNWYHIIPISYGIKILWYLKLIYWFKKFIICII